MSSLKKRKIDAEVSVNSGMSRVSRISRISRISWPLWTVSLMIFLVYFLSLGQYFSGGDSGELTFAIQGTGIPHAPGYPVYVLLAKIVSWMIPGSWSLRASLFSALCDTLAATLLAWTIRRLTSCLLAAWMTAVIFALSPLIWAYAVVPEVFALNNLFCSGIAALGVLLWERRKDLDPPKNWVFFAAFLTGFSLGNHHTIVLLWIPFWLSVLLCWKLKLLKSSLFAPILICFLVGIIPPYFYLVIASHYPAINQAGDLSSWKGFWIHFLRQEYGTLSLSATSTFRHYGLFDYLWNFIERSMSGLGWIGGLLALLGMVRKRTGFSLVLLSALVFYLIFFCGLSNLDLYLPIHVQTIERFWQVPWILVSLFAGLGLFSLLGQRRSLSLGTGLTIGLMGVGVMVMGGWNWTTMDHRNRSIWNDFGSEVLKELPQRSILLVASDDLYSNLQLLQNEGGLRQDVLVLNYLFLPFERYLRLARLYAGKPTFGDASVIDYFSDTPGWIGNFLDKAHQNYRVFSVDQFRESGYEARYALLPYGLVEEFVPLSGVSTYFTKEWEQKCRSAFSDKMRLESLNALSAQSAMSFDAWGRHILLLYWIQSYKFSTYLLSQLTSSQTHDPLKLKATLDQVEETSKVLLKEKQIQNPENLYKNLIVGYSRLPVDFPGSRETLIQHCQNFLLAAPPDHPARTAILDQLKSLKNLSVN